MMTQAPSHYVVACGREVTLWQMPDDRAEPVKLASVELLLGVQYMCQHPTEPVFYAACSDGYPGHPGQNHCICAFRFESEDAFVGGRFRQMGEIVSVESRPLHIVLSQDASSLLVTLPYVHKVLVWNLDAGGGLDSPIEQEALPLRDVAHQALPLKDGTHVAVVCRGAKRRSTERAKQGAVVICRWGQAGLHHVGDGTVLQPDDFGPRHLAEHPQSPWLYLAIENQNELGFLNMDTGQGSAGGSDAGAALLAPFERQSTLLFDVPQPNHQMASAVKVHPNGRFVYVSNRNKKVRTDGLEGEALALSNGVAVFRLHPETGHPEPVQAVSSLGVDPRTMCFVESGRTLIVANISDRFEPDGQAHEHAYSIARFAVGLDGRLTAQDCRVYERRPEDLVWIGPVRI